MKWASLFLPFFVLLGSVVGGASCEDFLRFAQDSKQDVAVLKTLYDKFLAHLTPDERPSFTAVGGSPGAGKTTFRKRFLTKENVHLHDMDEVMVHLPGYQNDLRTRGARASFEKWWPTARQIAQLLVQFAIKSGYSVTYDRTCGSEGSYADFVLAKERGYSIRLIGLCVDQEIAWQRITKREGEEGRSITEAILNEYRARFSALWPYYLSLVDEAVLYDMNTEAPKLVFSSQEGVQDTVRYQAFLEEGDAFKAFFATLIPRETAK